MSGTELVTNADAADPLRIVLVAPPYFDIPPTGYGGVEVVVADLADALVKRGHDVTVLGAGEPRTSARLIPLWERTLADRLGEPYPEIMHALKVRRVIERIATTDGVDIVHDHTFAGPLNTPAYSAVGIPTVVTVHGPIDDDLYPYYRELGDEVGLIAISDRQRELAPDLNGLGEFTMRCASTSGHSAPTKAIMRCSLAGTPRIKARIWPCAPHTTRASRWCSRANAMSPGTGLFQ